MSQPGLDELGVSLRLILPGASPLVLAHADQLQLVFTNLIRNAGEAMAGQASLRSIEIEVSVAQGAARCTVTDTGPGFTAGRQARAFEPYYTTKASKGMGMGLYLARKVVEAHDGTLTLRSEPGKGASFVITLPVETERQ